MQPQKRKKKKLFSIFKENMFSNKTMTMMVKKYFAQTQFSKLLSWLYKHSDYVALKVSLVFKKNKVKEAE